MFVSPVREKMPFHHVTAGLLYKGNYLSRSLSDSDSDVLASISEEELDGKAFHTSASAFNTSPQDDHMCLVPLHLLCEYLYFCGEE